MEIRSADCECNIYLVLTLLINAALDGIKNKMQAPKEIPGGKNPADIKGIKLLPDTLEEAKKIILDTVKESL